MKCVGCGITIPEVPEDACYEEMLCNRCYENNKMLNELFGYVAKENAGLNLSEAEAKKYVEIVDALYEADVEIPFGISM